MITVGVVEYVQSKTIQCQQVCDLSKHMQLEWRREGRIEKEQRKKRLWISYPIYVEYDRTERKKSVREKS